VLAQMTLSGRVLAMIAASSFLHAVKPIVTRVWVILFLLQNFRLIVSGGGADSVSDAVTFLSPIFVGVSGFVILIPIIIYGDKVLRRYVLKGVSGELKWKYSLLLAIFNFSWTHLICFSVFLFLLDGVGFYVMGLYSFVVVFCFLFIGLIARYRGGASNLITDLMFKNIGFGIYLLTASVYLVLVESFHLTLVQIFVIIMLPRLMLSSCAKTEPMIYKNSNLRSIKKEY